MDLDFLCSVHDYIYQVEDISIFINLSIRLSGRKGEKSPRMARLLRADNLEPP